MLRRPLPLFLGETIVRPYRARKSVGSVRTRSSALLSSASDEYDRHVATAQADQLVSGPSGAPRGSKALFTWVVTEPLRFHLIERLRGVAGLQPIFPAKADETELLAHAPAVPAASTRLGARFRAVRRRRVAAAGACLAMATCGTAPRSALADDCASLVDRAAAPALAFTVGTKSTLDGAGPNPGASSRGGAERDRLSATAELPRVAWGGDVLPGRAGERVGGARPLRALEPMLASADLAVANLEGPLVNRSRLGTALRVRGEHQVFGPIATAAGLATSGIDLMALANNHAADLGPTGLSSTLAALGAAGIHSVGVEGVTAGARHVSLLGTRLAILACDATRLGRPGSIADCREAPAAIDRAAHNADVVAVMVHWGREHSPRESAAQRRLARELAGAGADLIVGSHPHVVQPLEWLPRPGAPPALAVYSLGNLVWDSAMEAGRCGAILETRIAADGVRGFSLVPVITRGGSTRLAARRRSRACCRDVGAATSLHGRYRRVARALDAGRAPRVYLDRTDRD